MLCCCGVLAAGKAYTGRNQDGNGIWTGETMIERRTAKGHNGGNANKRANADGGYIRRTASVDITLDRVMSSPGDWTKGAGVICGFVLRTDERQQARNNPPKGTRK